MFNCINLKQVNHFLIYTYIDAEANFVQMFQAPSAPMRTPLVVVYLNYLAIVVPIGIYLNCHKLERSPVVAIRQVLSELTEDQSGY